MNPETNLKLQIAFIGLRIRRKFNLEVTAIILKNQKKSDWYHRRIEYGKYVLCWISIILILPKEHNSYCLVQDENRTLVFVVLEFSRNILSKSIVFDLRCWEFRDQNFSAPDTSDKSKRSGYSLMPREGKKLFSNTIGLSILFSRTVCKSETIFIDTTSVKKILNFKIST